ncbi:hypothetical protein HPB51_015565 [Rhipicephalus microplus]|uniref:SEC63 domain-containing protein n=1 Tax=Rhipicephalus microplus TaxID=6941 RepID=A0A9J6DHN4_RHIMP|nr:hypothetical protein HPB51_015565 [Rhipicephalus microplus]
MIGRAGRPQFDDQGVAVVLVHDLKKKFYNKFLYEPFPVESRYYGLEKVEPKLMSSFLSNLVSKSVRTLQDSYCLEVDSDERTLISTAVGKIASFYYLSHETMRLLYDQLSVDASIEKILYLLTQVKEYSELPVRHNEDLING